MPKEPIIDFGDVRFVVNEEDERREVAPPEPR